MGRGSIKRLWFIIAAGVYFAMAVIGYAGNITVSDNASPVVLNNILRALSGLVGATYKSAATPASGNLSVEGRIGIGTLTPDCVMTIQRNSATDIALGLHDNFGVGNSVDTAWFVKDHLNDYAWDLSFRNGAPDTGPPAVVTSDLGLYRPSIYAPGDLSIDFSQLTGNVGINQMNTDDASHKLEVNGSINATGDITKTKGLAFKIDHPTKKGMSLVHVCIEGPEDGVYYRGEAQLFHGTATVKLPEYFEALTRKDSRTVLLMAKGREPFLLSYTDITRGSFTVYGTKPDGKFSWEVQAVRSDIEPLKVEVPKT